MYLTLIKDLARSPQKYVHYYQRQVLTDTLNFLTLIFEILGIEALPCEISQTLWLRIFEKKTSINKSDKMQPGIFV